MKIIILILSIVLLTSYCLAQDKTNIDSLQGELRNYDVARSKAARGSLTISDSTKANLLFLISRAYRDYKLDSADYFARQCLDLSVQIGYKKGIGNAYNTMTWKYLEMKNFSEAIECQRKALQLRNEINDYVGQCSSYNNLGIIYSEMGNLPEALNSYLRSLKISEQYNYKRQIAGTYHNISGIYSALGNRQLALEFLIKAKKINTQMGNRDYLVRNLASIGDFYTDDHNYSGAQEEYFASIKLSDELGNYKATCVTYNQLGELYRVQHLYPKAIEYYTICLEKSRKIGYLDGELLYHMNVGEVKALMGKYKEALPYLTKALELSITEDSKERLLESYLELSKVHAKLKNYQQAYTYHLLYKENYDIVNDIEKQQKLSQISMQNEFNKTQDSIKVEQIKRDAITEEELQKQKFVRNSFISGFGIMLLFAGLFLYQRNTIKNGKKLSDNLLLNILPSEVAEELKAKGTADAKQFDNVTVLFTDFKSFTTVSQQLSPQELVNELHTCFKAFDEICTMHNIEKIKTIGDAYLAVCGLPLADEKHAEYVVNAALEIREFMAKRSKELGAKTFEIRIGINSGSVVAGIVGVKKFAYDIWGDTVNTAARMEQNSEAGKINISETTYALVKDRFTCEYRGEIDAKNKGKLAMYFVEKL